MESSSFSYSHSSRSKSWTLTFLAVAKYRARDPSEGVFASRISSSRTESFMPASIEDVAKLANVSISTVSRVINRRWLVNQETCKRGEAAIRELRYRPNAFARGLMLQKSGIVGLVLPD